MRQLWLVLMLCVLVSGVAPRVAAAAPDPSIAEALKHYTAATKAYNLGDFPRAIVEYKAAYDAKPDSSFLYNIAQAYRLSGDLEQALFFYRSYLRNLTGAANRRDIEQRIAQLETELRAKKAAAAEAPIAPPPAVAQSTPVTSIDLTTPPPVGQPKPVYKKGWFWGVLVASVVVAAGVGVGLGVGLTRGASPPSTELGNQKVFSGTTFSLGGAR